MTAPANWLKARSDNAALLVKTYRSGETFYRKYSDGFIVQGGYFANRNTLGEGELHTATLPTSFTSAKYKVFRSPYNYRGNNSILYTVGVVSQTTSSFVVRNDSSSYYDGTYWIAMGY